MAYNDRAILIDYNGKPIPQYWNEDSETYEPITSSGGKIRTLIVGKDGQAIQFQELVNQINDEIKKLVEVVE